MVSLFFLSGFFASFSGDKHGSLGSGLVEGEFRSGLFLGRVGKGSGERCDKQFSRRKIPT